MQFRVQATTPRLAAMKACPTERGLVRVLDEPAGRLHVFVGERRPVPDPTAYQRAHNLLSVAHVHKLGYANMGRRIRLEDQDDLIRVGSELHLLARRA